MMRMCNQQFQPRPKVLEKIQDARAIEIKALICEMGRKAQSNSACITKEEIMGIDADRLRAYS